MPRPTFDLYLITDPAAPDGIMESVSAAFARGVPKGRVALQLRDKSLSPEALVALGQQLRPLTAELGVPLLLNGPWQVAEAIGADGLQLPEAGLSAEAARAALGAGALLGRSCHDMAGIVDSASHADFVTLSPYHAVPGKGAPLSPNAVRILCRAAQLPVFALGGIGRGHVTAALESGASGIAVIRSVFRARNPATALLDLLAELDDAGSSLSPTSDRKTCPRKGQ